ncbi:Ig-like domain-containing protein [Cellulophaga tyrosinoxydans]|uniref:Uncharacterized protein n=1 Tax=Cellulophaga tyrosinoxydans TaxID=504486 RepID=A0A1W2A2M2_9FLAO|nr:Ig-like domain-containing protein [Cellulophaga tyrosinoxydans]SMC54904.1 hypothetical protein SAMN05660703_1749 [Cellulophaga tyrosinoxydans]
MIQLHKVNDFSPRNQKAMKNTKNALLMNIFIFSFFFFVSCTTDSEFFTDAILETPDEIIDEVETPDSEETEPVIDYQNGILTFAEDKVITLDLEKGASSYTGKSFALKSITQPKYGKAELDAKNALVLTPAADFHGVDNLSYTVDVEDASGTVTERVNTFKITVTPVKDVVDDVVSTEYETALTIAPLDNDRFTNKANVKITELSLAAKGKTVLNTNNTIAYTPNSGAKGVDEVLYKATITYSDGATDVETGKITITIAAQAVAPGENFPNPNEIKGTYYPETAADMADASKANFKAIITKAFNCSNCKMAPNQTIEPAGGLISGTNINLNGAYIINNNKQVFSASSTFSAIYEKSKLSPDTFGGFANDSKDDTDAIDALINNSAYALGVTGGKYIKNAPSEYKRQGTFDWDLNGAEIETNNNSKFRINTFDVDYVFTMTNLSPRIYNGEFDGTNTYGRLFWLKGQQTFYFADLNVHDYHSTSNARGIAFKTSLYPQTYGFTKGEFYRNTIDNISSDSDGTANNVNGLSKGFNIALYEDGTANVYLEGNTVTNIIGDDAECLYIAPHGSATMNNNVNFYLTNETYKYAKRRQAKITVSNVHIKDSYFEAPLVEQDFNGQAATILGVFSTISGQTNKNFELINCDIVSKGVHRMSGLSITEVENAKIQNNRFTWSDISNYAGISFGSATSGYNGILINNSIRDNTFTNTGIQFSSLFDVQKSPLTIDSNIFNFDYTGFNPGNYVAALRYKGYGVDTVNEEVVFINNIINFKATSSFNLFTGVVVSLQSSVENLTIENVTINYSGVVPTTSFGYIGSSSNANFNSSNTIQNCTINGASAIAAIEISGNDKSVNIKNSYDAGGNSLSIK